MFLFFFIIQLAKLINLLNRRCNHTAVKDGQVSVVCPAVFEQDGGVSEQAADAVPAGVLQAG